MKTVRYDEAAGGFELKLPIGWEFERDEEGGILVSNPEGPGLLHLIPFEQETAEEKDPAEELYTFLEDQGIELEEDEVEDLALSGAGSAAVCEYLAEEADELVYWMLCVATAAGQLVFASYSCPSEEAEAERDSIRGILSTLNFTEPVEPAN